ncbi:hypothetical protein [Haloferula sp.]|uniref:hypothetical protein n=1 Tax=Haloferula sp. TaxID=2497595 RepID=UPI003C70FA49
MARERILITVKTYPTLSQSHVELVCTAGFREDGSWVRIYPIPFRLLTEETRFPKWTWIELPLVRRIKDKRPESFSPVNRDDITILDPVSTADNWRERRAVVQRGRIWTNLTELIAAGKRDEVSLATFKPAKLLGFEWQPSTEDWDPAKLAAATRQLQQTSFLDADALQQNFKPARKVPYDFYYRFEDDSGNKPRLRILDWEIGMLYWNCRQSAASDAEALEKVRQMYETRFFQTDLHLFLGTTYEWHSRAPNPWVIIGVLPLPQENQPQLL